MSESKKRGEATADPRRNLPSMTQLLDDANARVLIDEYSRDVVKETFRSILSDLARDPSPDGTAPTSASVVSQAAETLMNRNIDRLRPVVNAMGIVLHTGLGRAPLVKEASQALSSMHMCCNLQVDMSDGRRGRRNFQTEQLLCRLTGAEAAMIVNNNAAATFLILLAFCRGKEVIVSRGQLIEIGGSFRLPDCMRQSGAVMKEVGTTNKTHLRDYEQALNENTAAIMRVYPSNYRVVGFTKSVAIDELSTLKKKQDFVLVDDLGCGALVDLRELGLPLEPTVPSSIAAGADLVCSSGDKLIGGPQAGLIMGRKDLIARIKKHPMTRMLRVCKLTDQAMQETLKLFLDRETLLAKHPVLGMMARPAEEVKKRALRMKRRLEKKGLPLSLRVIEDQSAVGGGALPDFPLDTYVLAVRAEGLSAEALSERLRRHETPIMARLGAGEVLFDVRTLLEGEERIVETALTDALTK